MSGEGRRVATVLESLPEHIEAMPTFGSGIDPGPVSVPNPCEQGRRQHGDDRADGAEARPARFGRLRTARRARLAGGARPGFACGRFAVAGSSRRRLGPAGTGADGRRRTHRFVAAVGDYRRLGGPARPVRARGVRRPRLRGEVDRREVRFAHRFGVERPCELRERVDDPRGGLLDEVRL